MIPICIPVITGVEAKKTRDAYLAAWNVASEKRARAQQAKAALYRLVAARQVASLMESSELDTAFVSTHVGSLSMLSDYLSARTGARLRVLAIQPASIELRKRLSPKVEETCLRLAELFSYVLAPACDSTG